ncbi:MAG TPA: rod shape-determining protein [Candidatus Xenobia bacterium]
MGLDLGTTQMSVCAASRVFREPAALAIDNRTRRVLAVGQAAYHMQGRSGGHIEVVHPVRDGMAAVPHLIAVLIRHALQHGLGWRRFLARPRVSVATPLSLSPIEQEALQEALITAGAGRSQLIPTPMAARTGAASDSIMVVDLGATRTQAAVLHQGELIAGETLESGGRALDVSISRWLRSERGLEVAPKQAETLKRYIACAVATDATSKSPVTGRELRSGLPLTMSLDSNELRPALMGPLSEVASLVHRVLAKTPPELATDLLDHGLVLTGGGARLRGLAQYLQTAVHLPVAVAHHPEVCAVVGSTGKEAVR